MTCKARTFAFSSRTGSPARLRGRTERFNEKLTGGQGGAAWGRRWEVPQRSGLSLVGDTGQAGTLRGRAAPGPRVTSPAAPVPQQPPSCCCSECTFESFCVSVLMRSSAWLQILTGKCLRGGVVLFLVKNLCCRPFTDFLINEQIK